jgi:hypothetical protein
MIQRREVPRWLGSSPIGTATFVASTMSSRRLLSALPTISSDSPPAAATDRYRRYGEHTLA